MVVGITIQAKNMHKVFGPHENLIKNSCKINIFMIDPIPIMSVEQVQGVQYIYDYKILKSMLLNKKTALLITQAVLDSNQYKYGITKKCPLMGKYAVEFKKGKTSVTLVISADPCGKAVIFCPGSTIDKKHIDLIDNGLIAKRIDMMFNPVTVIQSNNPP